MISIQEVTKNNRLNLIETSILVRIYDKHPEMILFQDLIDDEYFYDIVTNEFNSLINKGLIKVGGTKYGVVCGIS